MIIDNFEIYENESTISLTQRIAETCKSIPKFILILGIYKANTKTKITDVIDNTTLPIIKKEKAVKVDVWDAYSDTSSLASNVKERFETFYKTSKDNIQKLGVLADVVFIWCSIKIQFTRSSYGDFADIAIDQLFESISNSIPGVEDIINRNEFFNKLDEPTVAQYMNNLRARVQTNKENVQRFISGNNVRKSILGVSTTPFEREQIKIVWTTDISTLTLYEFFDALILSSKAPFASFDKFYKIQKGFRVLPEWKDTSIDVLIIKFYKTPLGEPIDILVDIFEGSIRISAEIDLDSKITNPEKDMILFIQSMVPSIKLTIKNTKIEDVSGVFYIPKQSIDVYVLEHLVLTNDQFSSFFIDESEKAAKTKSGIYTYFDLGSGNLLSLVLTSKIMDLYDPTMRGKSVDIFPLKSQYVRVKVSNAKSIADIELLMSTLSKTITLYNNQYKTVVALYRKYIKNFGTDEEEEEVVKSTVIDFKKIDKELFPSNYKRICQSAPTIVDAKDIEKYNNIMLYPATPEEGTQRYYTCETRTDNHKFIGLQKLKKETAKYKYVPCCFIENQEFKRGSKYNEYFNPVAHMTKKTQQRIVTGGKFLDYNTYGTFDDFLELKSLFVDPDENYAYYRWGTDDKNTYSFLQCIVEAIKYPMYDNTDEASRRATLKRIIRDIAQDPEILAVGKQSMYDKSTADVKNILLSEDENISPELFTDMFERKFECKVLLFGPASIESARTARARLTMESGNRVIMIFQHWGTDMTSSPYPRCELIVRANKQNKHDRSFVFSDTLPFVRNIIDIEFLASSAYFGKKPVVAMPMIPDGIKRIATHQIINSFGKTCAFVTKERFLIFLETPCEPLDMNETKEYTTFTYSHTQKYYTKNFSRATVTQLSNNGNIGILKFQMGDFVFYIPIKTGKDVPDTRLNVLEEPIIVPDLSEESMMVKFLKSQKIAKYLREYMAFMFSNFLHENNMTAITESVISKFVSERIQIVRNFEYKIKSTSFSENSFVNPDTKKIMISSSELLKRLIFSLRIDCTQRLQDVFEYYKKTKAQHFIIDMTDFQTYPNQVIVEGKESIEKYISGTPLVYPVSNRIIEYSKRVYFFQNSLVSDKTYIAYNVETLEDAYACVYNWNKFRIVSKDAAEFTYDTDVLTYVSNDNISSYHNANSPDKIVGYKRDDDPSYTVLLKFY